MMAEQKFSEAQKLLEVQLQLNNESRLELLHLYVEALESQHKQLPPEFTIELAEKEAELKNFETALRLINSVNTDKYFIRTMKIKISAAEEKGRMEELHSCLSDFLLRQYEKQTPFIPLFISAMIEKYFRHDFNLKLKRLAIILLLNDLEAAEKIIKELIISTVEKSSPKGVTTKLVAIGEVLKSGGNISHLEIYQNFCFISAYGINDKAEYKRLAEMVIYFEDFRFKAMLLNLLVKFDLTREAELYASTLRASPDFNFVYFDKYFQGLKTLFIQHQQKAEPDKKEEIPAPDLVLTSKYSSEIMAPLSEPEIDEDEQKYFHLLKYQNYTQEQLCDLAVSFLQSEMPVVALKASELALKGSSDDREFLKASYLKLMAQLKLNDFRAAVDTCFQGLTKAQSRDDVLSFMYGQAEAYIRLNQKKNAKAVLTKIISIDAKYRLAKERLDKLNEI
jgi:hypothetical protein